MTPKSIQPVLLGDVRIHPFHKPWFSGQSSGRLRPVNQVEVCCAIIEKDEKILAARRALDKSMGGKWEFPGGKVEPNENPEDALVREIREELGCEITVLSPAPPVSHAYADFTIKLIPFHCALTLGEPAALEHECIGWYTRSELLTLDWAEADLPIVDHLTKPQATPLANRN